MIYTVEENQHDFKPNDQPWYIRRSRIRCEFSFKLDRSMWYSIEKPGYPTEGGKPYKGWNKLGMGYTQGFFTNTKRSCMVAWFPNNEKNMINIALYINDKKGAWEAVKVMAVSVDKQYTGALQWNRNTAHLNIGNQSVSLPLRRSNWLPLRGIGAWFGGKYPSSAKRFFQATINYTII